MPQVGIPALARFLLTIILVTVTTPQALHAASPNSDAIASSVRSGTDALLGARDAWQRAATQTGRSAAEQQMLRVAAVRMQALQHLVESSPADAMAMALAPAARATFPASVQPYLESMRGVVGVLEVRWADYADHARRIDVLESVDERWTLHYTQEPRGASFQSGAVIAAEGLVVGDLLALDPTNVTATATAAETTNSAALPLPNAFGEQRLLVILVTFASNPAMPYTPDYVRNQFLGEVDAFYRDVSTGRTWLAVDVTPWNTVTLDPAVCDIESVAALADPAAKAQGFDPAGYARIAYVMPGMTCGWAGLAVTGPALPTRVWLTTVQTRVLTHELGHNLGLHHSRGRVCSGTDPWSSTCTAYEYGDLFDVMGNATGSPFNALQMRRLGYFDTDAGPSSTLVTASGQFTIGSYAGTGTQPRALRVPAGKDPLTGADRTLYVTLRQPVGRDAPVVYNAGYDAQRTSYGVEVHAGIEADGDAYLLDATPFSQTGTGDLNDAPFLVGESLVDSASGVTISPTQVIDGSATVAVTVSGSSVAPGPTNLPPVAVDDAASVASGGSVAIAVLRNDLDPEGGTLSVASVTQPAHGQVSIGSNGSLAYRPARKYTGSDSFTYVLSDGRATDSALVSVTVTAASKGGSRR